MVVESPFVIFEAGLHWLEYWKASLMSWLSPGEGSRYRRREAELLTFTLAATFFLFYVHLPLSLRLLLSPRVVSFSAANNHRRATTLVTTETEIAPSPKHSRCEPSQAPHQKRKINFAMRLFAWYAKVISWLLSCYECVFVGHHHVCPDLPRLTTVGKSCALTSLQHCLMIAPSWLDLVKILWPLRAKWWVENWGFWLGCWNHYYTTCNSFTSPTYYLALLDMLEMRLWSSRKIIL